jgi:hypothetical protein
MSAPDIILLTPNGRFELGKKASRRHRRFSTSEWIAPMHSWARLTVSDMYRWSYVLPRRIVAASLGSTHR